MNVLIKLTKSTRRISNQQDCLQKGLLQANVSTPNAISLNLAGVTRQGGTYECIPAKRKQWIYVFMSFGGQGATL